MDRFDFPFSALVGQEALKTALLISAVDPSVGGVLIRGEKGTGKSTAVRALAPLLPEIEAVQGCAYHSSPFDPRLMSLECRQRFEQGEKLPRVSRRLPFVELPLNATEDRLVGSLHVEETLRSGKRHFEPGLLAAANRGILYVDEVNLLDDHLVDMLLDAAVSGVNHVEREGVSYSHPARFILIGTMNPEEGDLRPQFIDRFALCVSVETLKDSEQRRTIVQRRLEYERDPEVFLRKWRDEDQFLSDQILQARERLPKVQMTDSDLAFITRLTTEADVQGHRADIAILKAASALAALIEKESVGRSEIVEAAQLVLPHRLRQSPLDTVDSWRERIQKALARTLGEHAPLPDYPEDMVDDEYEMPEEMLVPGSAAAGSILFTFVKKKRKNGSSIPMNT